MVVDPLASRGVDHRAASARRWRGSPPRDRGQARAAGRSHHRRRALRDHEGALDILLAAPEFDLVLGGRRLVRAGAAGDDGAADHRQRRRRKAAGGISCARCAGGAGGAEPRGRAELPHAGGLRRRDRGGAGAATPRLIVSSRGRASSGPAAGACSTSSRPARCSIASASRERRRSRSMPTSRRAPPCPSLSGRGQGSLRRDRAQERRRRRARGRRRHGARRRDRSIRTASPSESPARASRACWCSRWSRGSARF